MVGLVATVGAFVGLNFVVLDLARREGISPALILFSAGVLIVSVFAAAPIIVQLRTEITQEGISQIAVGGLRRQFVRWSEINSIVAWSHQMTGELVAIRLNSSAFSPKIALHYWDRQSLLALLRKALPSRNSEIDEIERRWK